MTILFLFFSFSIFFGFYCCTIMARKQLVWNERKKWHPKRSNCCHIRLSYRRCTPERSLCTGKALALVRWVGPTHQFPGKGSRTYQFLGYSSEIWSIHQSEILTAAFDVRHYSVLGKDMNLIKLELRPLLGCTSVSAAFRHTFCVKMLPFLIL